MSNWIKDLFSGKKTEPKEVFKDRDSIIPGYLKKAVLTEMETAEEDVSNDWHSRVHNVSDFVLAEQITELELVGKGAPENFNAHWQEVMGDVRKNRKAAEERLLKLVPKHSLLDVKEFFERIKKQNDKLEVAKARGKSKKSDLTFAAADTLVAKGTCLKVSVLGSDAGANIYVVKTAFNVNYYGAGDAHETFEKVGEGLEKEAAKTGEQAIRNVLEQKDASGSWQEVTSSPLLKDLQIRAEYILANAPDAYLRVQSLEEPLFHEGEKVSDASGRENAEVLQVDKENGMYVMKIPGFPTPVRKTFEKAHAGFHAGPKDYLPGIPKANPKETGSPESLPKSKTEYISEEERAKLVKMRKEIEETEAELATSQEYSRHWQDLTRKLQDLKARSTEMSGNKLLEPGMTDNREPTPAEKEQFEKSKAIENARPEPGAAPKTEYLPPKSQKLDPEGWQGWPNTVQNLKPNKHKKTSQGFELSLIANSLTLSLPNGSFLTSVHTNELEAAAEFDKADDLDSLALLFPIAILEAAASEVHHKNCEALVTGNPDDCSCADVAEVEKKAAEDTPSLGDIAADIVDVQGEHSCIDSAIAKGLASESDRENLRQAILQMCDAQVKRPATDTNDKAWVEHYKKAREYFANPKNDKTPFELEKKAEDVGTGGPNMDGSNVMVDPQRGGTNQMGMGVEENPKPFKKESEEDPIEAQLMADMDELVEGAGGAEAVIAKAMEAGAKSREEIAGQAVKALVAGPTHEVDFETQLSAKGPNSSAQAEPDWEHHNQKFTLAECVPAMERALDEFLPEKEASKEPPMGAPASLDSQTFVAGETVILNSTVGALSEGTEVRITGVVGSSVAFEAVHDSKIIGITKFAKVDKQMPLEKYEWDNDGIKVAFELGDHVKVASPTFVNGKALKGREGTIREKVIFSEPDAEVNMFYLVEFDGAECTTLPGDCLKRGSTKKASFLGHKEATLEVVSIIVKGPRGWSVKSHDGKKNLGGPYGSREKALVRLRQIEYFKHQG